MPHAGHPGQASHGVVKLGAHTLGSVDAELSQVFEDFGNVLSGLRGEAEFLHAL